MKIITSHERADMDALASIYAASLLYPDYQPVLPSKLNRNLRDFVNLYKDELPFIERSQLDRRHISDLILVDTQAISRMRGMDDSTRQHIIDHHTVEGAHPEGVTYEGEPLGATTTLLVERLCRGRIKVSPLGASLMLMGIYEDTGSLSYPTTTARDAEAAAWLMRQGADLGIVSTFLHRPLSEAQRDALARLVSGAKVLVVQKRDVCIAALELEEYVDELSTLVHEVMDIYEPDACFLLVRYEDSIQIIARSTTDAIDVAALLNAFGGGGHTKAAAALVQGMAMDEAQTRLLELLERHVEPPTLVRELMSTNVHTLDLNMAVRDAAQLMRRYGHEGFPVVEGERLVGILTRSDVDRALHHRLGEIPVRNILHTGPLYVRSQDPVDEVQRVMIEHGLGQVPVVDEGRFVGIVTRTDLIKHWTPTVYTSRAQEIRQMMEEALPEALTDLLLRARDAANDLGHSLYIVGGFVRDLLLGAPTLDLDLVVEGDAIGMAQKLAADLGGRVRSHARFGTAKVILEGEMPAGLPPSLDFVTARTEFYERPSVLPNVERSSIKQDLYRRDFTINTMAICLDRGRYGELLDYYGGERDIRARRIRVLHNLSFVEDPTRILRAVRFEQRLGFTIEARTAELIGDALELLDDVTGERLRHELYLILEEAEPEKILDRLSRMNALEHMHPALRFTRDMAPLFPRLREHFSAWPAQRRNGRHSTDPTLAPDEDEEGAPTLSLCYMALLTSTMSVQEQDSFVARLMISLNHARFLRDVMRLRESLPQLHTAMMLPSSIYRLLHPYSREARFVLSMLIESDLVRQRLEFYEQSLSKVAPRIDGHYLRSLGVPPGPIYGEILSRVRDALLDGEVVTLEDEQILARRLVEASHGKMQVRGVPKTHAHPPPEQDGQ
jgi:tRNA nucleotidyltransferase (CCA-adding enzyme)